MNLQALFRILLASVAFYSLSPFSIAADVELIAKVPPMDGIKIRHLAAMQVLDSDPNVILFATENQGAGCGGGTPASVWKLEVDSGNIEFKQSLSLIQNVRAVLFESTNGTLFTGGGWCGYSPPYYSTDGGDTWYPANKGVHPPNSTFSFVEFKGDIYAGTGYSPYHAQVYRWLGDGGKDHWKFIFDIPPPRTIITSRAMVVYENQLYVGSIIYGGSNCEGSVPVYVSSDAVTFKPTSGIPPCYNVRVLLVVNNHLVAQAFKFNDNTEIYMYRWSKQSEKWVEIGPYPLGLEMRPLMVSYNGIIYAYGKDPRDASRGIYQSVDIGKTWMQIAVIDNPIVQAMTIHNYILYMATSYPSDIAYFYKLELSHDDRWCLDSHCYQRFDDSMSWHMAKVHCENENGYLATLTSVDEQDFVFANLVSGSPNDCWIGATDEAEEGNWQWFNEEKWEYENWDNDQPNNCDDFEHYGAMSKTDGTWQDKVSLNDGSGSCDCPVEFEPMSTICEWGDILGDLNGDNRVNKDDYEEFRNVFGKCTGDSGFNSKADCDEDGCVSYRDYWIWYTEYYMD